MSRSVVAASAFVQMVNALSCGASDHDEEFDVLMIGLGCIGVLGLIVLCMAAPSCCTEHNENEQPSKELTGICVEQE
jgi:hypothetical protein